jgi:C-terminal processing protease CtpA/Prc
VKYFTFLIKIANYLSRLGPAPTLARASGTLWMEGGIVMASTGKSSRGGSSRDKQKRPKKRASVSAAPPHDEAAAEQATLDQDASEFLAKSVPLRAFLSKISAITPDERALIVKQAIVLLEGFYAHLPLKRAMHAIDPLQRLRLLQHRLGQFETDLAFHAEMTDIFTSLRDLHTNYLLPDPFNAVAAFLPFRVEEYFDGGARKYLVADVTKGFSHPTFGKGVEVLYWSGIPIERAIEIAASQHAGSNPDARRSRGIAGLTARALKISPPPDEEWVIVGYRTADKRDLEIRLDWRVSGLPQETAVDPESLDHRAAALGIDLETDAVRQVNKALYAPNAIAAHQALAAAADPIELVRGTTDSLMPTVFKAREVDTKNGKFGYIRIFTFSVGDADAFVAEFVRLAALLPQNGLIVDVRDNGGGLVFAGERLLQVLTPRRIEPERVQFINTPLTLQVCQAAPANFNLKPWIESIDRSVETGATFSSGFPITSPDSCNAVGQRYQGPVVLVTSARCYSTTDFFAAGFQDHSIGPVLGVDDATGAGGANVWTHDLIRQVFERAQPRVPSPLIDLPNNAGMRVAIRRSVRVGTHAGTEVEDLGVKPDVRHKMTRNDLLNDNVDLIEHAAELLAKMPVRTLSATVATKSTTSFTIAVTTKNVARVDVAVAGRPCPSRDVTDGTAQISVAVAPTAGSKVDLQGYVANDVVAACRVVL